MNDQNELTAQNYDFCKALIIKLLLNNHQSGSNDDLGLDKIYELNKLFNINPNDYFYLHNEEMINKELIDLNILYSV